MDQKNLELAKKCTDLANNSCKYSAVTFLIWVKFLTIVKVAFISISTLLGSFASLQILTESDLESAKIFIAICTFIASILPAIYSALKLDDSLSNAKLLASEFRNLEDRFEVAAKVSSQKPFDEFEEEFNILMQRLEEARKHSYTPPEWCFKDAQKKIKSGDYDNE